MKRRTFVGSMLQAGMAALTGGLSRAQQTSAPAAPDVDALTLDGRQITLPHAEVEDLRVRLGGRLLQPGADQYESARRIWNGSFDRRPALIARCSSTSDVRHAVSFARSHRLLTAVRGGGHSLSGQSVCDGGLMIDLALMKAIRVDPRAAIAHVEPGVLLGELDQATQAFGLATPAGTVTHTGIAGLTLGGGFGRLARRYGLTCDNLRSVNIVTADGTTHYASESENRDLFWAVRGGGGNFGIVTSFEFRLHRVGPQMLGGTLLFPFANVSSTVTAILDLAANAPDELWLTPTLIRLPDGQRAIAAEACYCGDMSSGERVLRPLERVGKPFAGEIVAKPYVELQRGLDAISVPGRNYYYKSGFVTRVNEELVEEVVRNFEAAPPCVTAVPFIHTGGAIGRVLPSGTAFWNRRAQCDLLVQSDWAERADGARNIASARALWARLEAFTEGFYINTDTPDDEQRLRSTFGDNYDRLARIKTTYDPDNLFRLNANIRPA